MKLIIGLGNPDKKFEDTRHNLGFLAIENLKLVLDSDRGLKIENFSDWKYEKKFQAEISKWKIGEEKVILVKPQTFMNLSGKAIISLVKYYKIKPDDIWVIYDDINLPLGKIRIRQSGSSGGHKGVQSIINELKSDNFIRFRVGINPDKFLEKSLEKFVLKKFTLKEKNIIKKTLLKIEGAIILALEKDINKAMSEYN